VPLDVKICISTERAITSSRRSLYCAAVASSAGLTGEDFIDKNYDVKLIWKVVVSVSVAETVTEADT
jgi:hypothetical protein